MGRYAEAAEVLNNRTNLSSLELALELAEKAENKDLISCLNSKIEVLKKNDEKKEEPSVQSDIINILPSRFEAMMLQTSKESTEKHLEEVNVETAEEENFEVEIDNLNKEEFGC